MKKNNLKKVKNVANKGLSFLWVSLGVVLVLGLSISIIKLFGFIGNDFSFTFSKIKDFFNFK